jgi:hypothetical protein
MGGKRHDRTTMGLLGVAAALALSLGVWFLWPVSPAVRAYERLRLGMAESEVEAAIGVPPNFRQMPSTSGYEYDCWVFDDRETWVVTTATDGWSSTT